MTDSAEQIYQRALSEMKKEQWLAAIKLLKHNLAVVQKNWRFSWNLGWCYFNLDRFDDAQKHMIRAATLAPENPICKWGLGSVYLKRKQFKKAEVVLAESLRIKDSYPARIALALAYLSQRKVAEAEKVHLEGIRLKPKNSARYESYAAFLSDVGREAEAQEMVKKLGSYSASIDRCCNQGVYTHWEIDAKQTGNCSVHKSACGEFEIPVRAC